MLLCLSTKETDHERSLSTHERAPSRRAPWNKGKRIGAKPPLRPSHVSSIRTKLQMKGLERDLALFNLAIDSKLRGCDVVVIHIDDVAPNGYALDRATARQSKTGRPVRFELTEQRRGRSTVLATDRLKARSIPVRRPRSFTRNDHPAIRSAGRILGCQERTRSE
jgi:hypothetical protein